VLGEILQGKTQDGVLGYNSLKSFFKENIMPKTAIITDTDASLPVELAAKYNIQQVPITIQFGEESFRAVYDLNDAATFARIDREGKLPTTSAPSPGQFVTAFKSAFDAGAENILCLTVSSEVSATYAAAINAAADFADKDITVLDTRTLSMGQGLQVLYAAEALSKGKSKEEALAIAQSVGERTLFFAALSTLKYLAMSGRVSQLTAGIAGIIDLKPILTIRNGKLDMLERVRTKGKATGRVIDLCAEQVTGRTIERVAIIHVAAPEAAKQFEEKLHASLAYSTEALFCEVTPGLSVHSGAGMVGVAIVVQ
jgi:DegV family protein with EDD domain